MKNKIYNPASTNQTSPAEGMAAVNTFNSEETEGKSREQEEGIPTNFERTETREQHDDTEPVEGNK